jgi:GNAT superfamily N-acetyltransferase
MEWTHDGYTISDDRSRLDVDAIHRYLSEESYWARGIPRERVERGLRNSLCFGLYRGDELVGFARAITDRASFAYLADVFVLDPHRGRGLGIWLVETVLGHPDLQDLRQFILGTADAHSLYERFGWKPLERIERFMSIERLPEELYGEPPGDAAA